MHGKFGLFMFHFTGLESHIHFEFLKFFLNDEIKDISRKVENDFKLVHFIDLKFFRCLTYFTL